MNIGAVVLAAGASTRLGSPKQLVVFEGKALVVRAVEAAADAGCRPVIAVLGAKAELVAAELRNLPVRPVVNAEWKTGMGSSIRAGVAEALRLDPNMDALLIMVCDQPRVGRTELEALLGRFRASDRPIAAARYGGALGVPAVFGRSLFPVLGALAGDAGARKVINQRLDDVAAVDLPQAVFDIDSPDDLALLANG